MTARVVVVGLGPAGAELLNTATLDAIDRIPADRRYLRTGQHPAADALAGAATFDDVYETANTFDEVYRTIADRLVAAAGEHGEVLYAVPGSPAVLERSVELLVARTGMEVEVVPAMSFVDLVWSRIGIDPVDAGVRLVDGHVFATAAAGERGPLLVAHCHSRRVLSDVKLAVELDDPPAVTVMQRLGTPDEAVFDVPWADLDRSFEPDHLTTLWIPRLAAPVTAELVRFDELVHTLRRECPWDREQTHHTLGRHLVEECYEVLEAIDGLGADGEGDGPLEEELGDLLFQVVFHATLAGERGAFTLADVARGIHDKLVARHPHVFGDVAADDSAAVLRNWEEIKRDEKGRSSVMDGIPAALPALALAEKVQRKAARLGFGLSGVDAAWSDLGDELAELRAEPTDGELGDVLFSVVQVARQLDVDPEAALRDASRRFERRFRHVEASAVAAGTTVAEAEPDWVAARWGEAKEQRG